MTDKKVYKTDYESDATQLLRGLASQDANPAVKREKTIYDRVFKLRDKAVADDGRNKFWSGF